MKRVYNQLSFLGFSAVLILSMSCQESDEITTPVIPGKILYTETFEGAEPFSNIYNKEIGDSSYALQYGTDIVYRGKYSARFEVKKGEGMVADGIRSEVVITKPSPGEIVKNSWYSFAVYFPSTGYLTDHTHEVISQWVILDGSPVRLITEDDKIKLDVGSSKDVKEKIRVDTLLKDKWHELVIHIIHSHDENLGLIEVWYDGVKKITRKGGNLYDAELPKWKIGMYKASYEPLALDKADTNKRIIFFDNIKMGDQNCTYLDMVPNKE